MKLADYMRQEFAGNRQQGMVGSESEWLDLCSLDIPVGNIHVVDPQFVTDQSEGCIISLRPGLYNMLVKTVVYGDDVRIARIQVVTGSDKLNLGGKIDETGTDSATVGVYDFKTLSPFSEESREAVKNAFQSASSQNHYIIEVGGASGGRMAIVHSGFGDGTFPVYELLTNSERAGFEVVFIPTGQPYPFSALPATVPSDDEEIHLALVEKIWDAALAALNNGEEPGRQFFENLKPGIQAALASRIFSILFR
jgi:hypothetical protein